LKVNEKKDQLEKSHCSGGVLAAEKDRREGTAKLHWQARLRPAWGATGTMFLG
jgi:hypothetical protein